MAKQTLPTNFKDDIMNAAMGGLRRYQMINNADGTVSFKDVTKYDQVGSDFKAADANAVNAAVNASQDASKVISSYEDLMANTQSGYFVDALVAKELSSNLKSKDIFPYISSIKTGANFCDLNIDNSKRTIKTVTVNAIFSYYMKIIANGTEILSINNEQYSKIPVSVDVSSYDSFIIKAYLTQYNSTDKDTIDTNSISIS